MTRPPEQDARIAEIEAALVSLERTVAAAPDDRAAWAEIDKLRRELEKLGARLRPRAMGYEETVPDHRDDN